MTAPTYKPPINPAGYVSEAYYGQILDEFVADTPPDLIWPNSVQTYAAMRRDATCSAVLDGYLLQLLRATWQLDGRGCDPELTKLVADDMGLRVVGSEEAGAARTRGVSWEDHIESALTSKLTFGHMGFALGADLSGGEARLKVLAERLPQTLTQIHADSKTGEFQGVTQMAARRDGRPEILARNMVWYCHKREGANWAGTSIFRPAWMAFRIKKEMVRVHATSNRRWGAGVPVMEALPGTAPTPGQMAEAMQMAAAARSGETAGAASPPGFTMKILGLSGAVPDTLGFIEWLDRQVSRAALMPHIELGQGSAGGSRALGTAFIDSWLLALETLAEKTAMEATRQIAARIVEWNRGPDEAVPTVVVSGIGSRREVTAESLNQLLQSGALSADPGLEAWVRREYRLPEREESGSAPAGRIFESDIATGMLTKNERRGMLSLPPVEGGDVLLDPKQPAPAPKRKAKPQADGQLELDVAASTSPPAVGVARGGRPPGRVAVGAAAEGSARLRRHEPATLDQDDDGSQAAWTAAVAGLLAAWPALAVPLVDDLAAQAEATVGSGDVAGLGTLAASAATVDALAATLTMAMTGLATTAAQQVVASAAAQGVTVDQPEPDHAPIAGLAAATAAWIASGYATAAARRAVLAPAGQVAAVVRATLMDMSSAERGMVADHIGAALSTAQGQGRLAVLAANPAQGYRADESGDKSACVNCREADGRTYPTLAAALVDYPNGVQNARCEGGARCRGALIPVWT